MFVIYLLVFFVIMLYSTIFIAIFFPLRNNQEPRRINISDEENTELLNDNWSSDEEEEEDIENQNRREDKLFTINIKDDYVINKTL